jgi:SAM-dependent methyltransferase
MPAISRPSLRQRAVRAYRRGGFAVFVVRACRKIGGAPLRCLQHVLDDRIDRRYDLDTRGLLHPADMPFANPNKRHATNYQATTERTFRAMMAYLPRSLAGFDFIDIGCGKGRVLFYAAALDFKRIVGIEFAPPLAAIAKKNSALLEHATGEKRIEIRCQDAVEMDLSENPCVLFFASPFMDEVLEGVAAFIEASYRAHPRKIFVIYYGVQSIRNIEARFGFLKLIARGAEWRDWLARDIYPYAIFGSPE